MHFLWSLENPAPAPYIETILTATRSITHLGWGVDLVVADAALIPTIEAAMLEGRKWQPAPDTGATSLRTPRPGTFDDLEHRHHAFLNRVNGVDGGTFSPVPPLRAYLPVDYQCETDPVRPPYAIFALRQLDDSGFRAFDPVRRGLHVAAMLRHVASGPGIARSLGWTDAQIARLVHGHANDESSATSAARLLFIPLPSLEPRGQGKTTIVGAIRRILVTAHGPIKRDAFRRLAQRLDGLELIEEKTETSVALLSRLSDSDKLTSDNYLASSATWATVTPIVLPGYDDPRKLRQRLGKGSSLTTEEKNAVVAKLDQRIDQLLRKALRQAGYPEVIARHAAIEWRGSGYWPGTDLASRYMAGDQHRRFRKIHVRIQFRDEHGHALAVPGPLCIGGGKFSGTGLFAATA